MIHWSDSADPTESGWESKNSKMNQFYKYSLQKCAHWAKYMIKKPSLSAKKAELNSGDSCNGRMNEASKEVEINVFFVCLLSDPILKLWTLADT